MAIPMFLAITGAEWGENRTKPEKIAWMACHFSPYGTGLSNCPTELPTGSMIILNDRTPICGHDPERIAQQLSQIVQELNCCAVLLDFQRPDEPDTDAVIDAIWENCRCPVGVTEYYARNRNCPVFLSPVPLNVPVAKHFDPWKGREIWLDIAMDAMEITITKDGTRTAPLPDPEPWSEDHRCDELHCHYHIDVHPERIQFQLYRTPEDIVELLRAAEEWGATHAIGLFQEFGNQLAK